ncbi:unnamed protein product [Taenia asiatica]|uniref:Secreted protein n=1 Tax=Taenia asiatica TaxID=60517 RepID=A0A0R3VXE8_TAEAS|nr:unnamed protein product [Taenia asiatica]
MLTHCAELFFFGLLAISGRRGCGRDGAKLWTRAPVCLLELNSLLVFAGPAVIVSDDAYAVLFDKLPDRPSGYRCSRLVDHWPPCPFTAIATDTTSLARSSVHASKAYHCILFLSRVLHSGKQPRLHLINRSCDRIGEDIGHSISLYAAMRHFYSLFLRSSANRSMSSW